MNVDRYLAEAFKVWMSQNWVREGEELHWIVRSWWEIWRMQNSIRKSLCATNSLVLFLIDINTMVNEFFVLFLIISPGQLILRYQSNRPHLLDVASQMRKPPGCWSHTISGGQSNQSLGRSKVRCFQAPITFISQQAVSEATVKWKSLVLLW